MSRKALLLFVATSVTWGSSFPFIRLAVEHLPPSAVVCGRAVLGAELVYRRWLADVPAVGVTALMTALSSLAFLRRTRAPGREVPASMGVLFASGWVQVRFPRRQAATSRGQVARKGGKSGSYDDRSKQNLVRRAREVGIKGRSTMSKAQLARGAPRLLIHVVYLVAV